VRIARISAYLSRRYSADVANGEGGEVEGGVVEVDVPPPRPHARHATASLETRLSKARRAADASPTFPVDRCIGLASLRAVLHA
jgi:hypothetical protein